MQWHTKTLQKFKQGVRQLTNRKWGVSVRTAIVCDITSMEPWRSAKTPGIQQALSNACLQQQELSALRDG